MANGQFNLEHEQFKNEVRKERHRRIIDYIAAGIVGFAVAGCAVIVGWPNIVSKSEDGKTTVMCGPDESTKSWAKTLLTTLAGAAAGFVFKQIARPTPGGPGGGNAAG